MGAIKELSYKSFDSLLDEVRLELKSFNSAGDIDAAELISVAQTINYELGLKIYQRKECMLEVAHGRAKLPSDFYQMKLALVCYEYNLVSTAPWNGNVLLEQLDTPLKTLTTDLISSVNSNSTVPVQSTTVFCWNVNIPADAVCNDFVCNSTGKPNQFFSIVVQAPNGTSSTQCFPIPSTSTIFAMNITQGIVTCPVPAGKTYYTKGQGAYLLPDGTYSCTAPTPVPTPTICPPGDQSLVTTCDICNVIHTNGLCPEVVINPYPLGKCRTICNDSIGIKILRYCESSIECYERFERLYIDPFIQASGFNSQRQFPPNHGAINGKFLELPSHQCTKVYINYLGALEDDDGNLLIIDHPQINNYYKTRIKRVILENLYINGEDLIQRVQYLEKQEQEYKWQALNIINTPNFRDLINTFTILRQEHNQRYYYPLSRYHGYLGCANPIDDFSSM